MKDVSWCDWKEAPPEKDGFYVVKYNSNCTGIVEYMYPEWVRCNTVKEYIPRHFKSEASAYGFMLHENED